MDTAMSGYMGGSRCPDKSVFIDHSDLEVYRPSLHDDLDRNNHPFRCVMLGAICIHRRLFKLCYHCRAANV